MQDLLEFSLDLGRRGTPAHPRPGLNASGLVVAVWFGIFTGTLEAAGLLIFQRINWRQWGMIPHVSLPILWISPLVDVVLFCFISLIIAFGAWALGRSPLRLTVSVLVFLTVFDLLGVSWSLYYIAILLLALGVTVSFDRWWPRRQRLVFAFWRKSCPLLVTIWLLVFCAIQGTGWWLEQRSLANLTSPAQGTPNVVLIVVDTLRADHLSVYGYSRSTTPNIDRMAREGVLFENAIAASSWTLPSHASMLTGRYPSDHGVRGIQSLRWPESQQPIRYPTLGDALLGRGYRTGAFSGNQIFFTSSTGLDKGFIHFEDYFQSPRDMFLRTFFGRDGLARLICKMFGISRWMYSYKSADEVNREGLRWIDHDQRPFLAVLNYIGVHEAEDKPWTDLHPVFGTNNQIDRYDSALSYTDSKIGDLIEKLARRGLLSNTLVIITSDHGQALGQHHLLTHGSALYLEQIHVPLIIWYPGHVPAGMRVKIPISNTEIAPTVMDIVSGTTDPFPDIGLSPLWRATPDRTSLPRMDPVSELAQVDIADERERGSRNLVPTAMDGDMRAIVTTRWHLIEHQKLGMQLYDWVNDPSELSNLINTPEGRKVGARLETQMNAGASVSASLQIKNQPLARNASR